MISQVHSFLVVIIILLISNLELSNSFDDTPALYGEPCSQRCDNLNSLECKNGTCSCISATYLFYNKNMEPTCEFRFFLQSYFGGCLRNACNEDQECKEKQCLCKGNKTMINDNCYEAVMQEPIQSCYSNPSSLTAYLCDSEKFSFCKNKKCVCYKKYFYNSTTNACELKSKSPFPNYKALPEEYCLETSDCLDGLKCSKNFTCACPSPCHYVKDEGICDCGEVELKNPQSVIWVGVILGILSVAFWFYVIRRTCRNRLEKDSDELHDLQLASLPYLRDRPLETTSITSPPRAEPPVDLSKDLPPSYDQVVTSEDRFPESNARSEVILPSAPPSHSSQDPFLAKPPSYLGLDMTGDSASTDLPFSSASGLPYPAASNSDLPYPAASNSDLPYPAASNPDLPYPAAPKPDLPYPAASNSDLPYPTAPKPDLPYPAAPNPDLPYPAAPTPDLPYPAAPTPDLPYPNAPSTNFP